MKATVIITGIDLNIKSEVEDDKLATILSIIYSSSSPTVSQVTNKSNESVDDSKITVREYLNEKSPKTGYQKLLVVASYLEKILGNESVTADDMKLQLERAREAIPTHFSRDFNKTIKMGWLAESHSEAGKFFVTTSGDNALNQGFKGPKKQTSTNRARTINRTPVNIRKEIESLPVDGDLEAGIYWKITKKADRILYILLLSSEKGAKWLNQKEISYFSRKLGDDIPTKSITALIEIHKKEGRVLYSIEDSARALSLLRPGVDYLKSNYTFLESREQGS